MPGTAGSCQPHHQTALFPPGQGSHCMTPFHSTAADSTSVRAMEEQILPVPQPQRQREAKTPWDAHCPAQPSSCALQRDILPCFRSSLRHGTQGVSQCFGGSFADLQHKGALLLTGSAGPLPGQESCLWCGAMGPHHMAQGAVMAMCGFLCSLVNVAGAATAPCPWRPSWEVISWVGAWWR